MIFEAIIIVLCCLIFRLYFYFNNCHNYWKSRHVPFEKPKPFFGNLLDILLGNANLGKYTAKLYEKIDASYFGMYILNKPILVVKDPNILKHIFVKDFHYFTDKNFFTDIAIDELFSKSIISASGKKWKLLRSQLTKTFSTGKIKAMVECEKITVKRLVDYLKSKNNKNFSAVSVFGSFVTDSIVSCFYGIGSNCFKEKNPIKFHGFNLFPKSGYDSIKIYSYNFIHEAVKLFKFKFFNKSSAKFLKELFKDVLRIRKWEKFERNDFVDLLISLKEMNNDEIDEAVVLSQAITFLVAGQDTTNLITSFAVYELCKNVEVQDKLRNEINDTLREQEDISYELINNMKYLDMVILETLRKYPVVNFLQRKCVQDYTLPGTGLLIERNTNIMIPIHGLHFDPKYYPEPEKFNPERFNASNKQKINSYSYLPFGTGPRNCIGKRFALLTIKIALIYILKNFKIYEDVENVPVFHTSHIGYSANDFRIHYQLTD
ncbi:hypothetical protein FQR65_LT03738 [Abscondita terminalis]|nr:hypothetical protein FQR65_LT03738 [Abscondita terminalis]